MLLTVSKRLEFSASRRLFVRDWTESENVSAFGPETKARHGTGRNYVAYFIFTGPVDATTGMLINISEIKERAGKIVQQRFDHKFLNEQNPTFADLPPTPENVAWQLYVDVAPLFSDVDAKLCACHLTESPDRSAKRKIANCLVPLQDRTDIIIAHDSPFGQRSSMAKRHCFGMTQLTPRRARCVPNSIIAISTKSRG